MKEKHLQQQKMITRRSKSKVHQNKKKKKGDKVKRKNLILENGFKLKFEIFQ